MNIKSIAEKMNKNYDSDNSIGRSKSCNKEIISNKNKEEDNIKEKSKKSNNRFLIEKIRYENLENDDKCKISSTIILLNL